MPTPRRKAEMIDHLRQQLDEIIAHATMLRNNADILTTKQATAQIGMAGRVQHVWGIHEDQKRLMRQIMGDPSNNRLTST